MPNGQLIASGGQDETVVVWDANTYKPTLTIKEHTDGVVCLAFSPDSRRIVSSGYDEKIKIWDVQTGRVDLNLRAGTLIGSVAFSPNGRWVIGETGRQVFVWGAKT